MSFQGRTKVNFSYEIDCHADDVGCGLRGIPTVDGADLVDAAPRIDNGQTWCLARPRGLVRSSIGVLIAVMGGLALGLGLKAVVRKPGSNWFRIDTGGSTCTAMRRAYQDCL
jgi:hypothetical protein